MLIALKETIKDVIKFGPKIGLRIVREACSSKIYTVRLPVVGRIFLRKRSSDFAVARQVFRDQELDPNVEALSARIRGHYEDLLKDGFVPLIIDVGANIGMTVLWFTTQFPDARVAALEPDPENYKMLRLNTADRKSVTLFDCAIGGEAGEVALSNQHWAVQTVRSEKGGIRVMTIDEITASFDAKHKLMLVKVDIEGFESDLFGSNTRWLDDVASLVIEVHDWLLPGQYTSVPLQRATAKQGFEMLIRGENIIYVR